MGDTVEIRYALTLLRTLTDRLAAIRRPRSFRDAGSVTTETVIIIAGLAALALAVVTIIVAKVTEKANSIPTS